MCGRYAFNSSPEDVMTLFNLATKPEPIPPRYNIAPSLHVPVVGLKPDNATRALTTALTWGLLPAWANSAKDRRYPNARAETVHILSSFRDPFARKRCIMVASGFYEWKAVTMKDKRPHFIRMRTRQPFGMAALWDVWTDGVTKLLTCCLVTTGPNDVMGPIHDRMPVILPPERFGEWLDPDTSVLRLKNLLTPYPAEQMEAFAVSKYVSKAGNEGPQCIEPIGESVAL